ncbi:hypothetical protein [uncultured Thomasclavelia sp.]|nr:hypothetical protein [uncultured Thomasclavelia sp.]
MNVIKKYYLTDKNDSLFRKMYVVNTYFKVIIYNYLDEVEK